MCLCAYHCHQRNLRCTSSLFAHPCCQQQLRYKQSIWAMQSMKEQVVSEMREVRSEVTGEVQEGEGQKWMMIGEGGKEGGGGRAGACLESSLDHSA